MTDAAAALNAAAQAGEFFTLDRPPSHANWLPLHELVRAPTGLDERITAARRVLARAEAVAADAVPVRTTASVDLLGLSARVLAPALGAAGLAGIAPAFALDRVLFSADTHRLCVIHPTGRSVPAAHEAAEALHADVVTTVLAPLVAAYADRFRLSGKVLWGNVASALNGSADVLEASGLNQVLPVRDIVAALLRTPILKPTVRSRAPRFVRNNCCLYYRIPGAGTCGDCLLTA